MLIRCLIKIKKGGVLYINLSAAILSINCVFEIIALNTNLDNLSIGYHAISIIYNIIIVIVLGLCSILCHYPKRKKITNRKTALK